LLFADCFPNTLDTTVVSASANDTFIITGDINAMWLRDSSWQVFPYFPYISADPHLQSMIQVRRVSYTHIKNNLSLSLSLHHLPHTSNSSLDDRCVGVGEASGPLSADG
jgi:hypothetical protein